MKKFLFTLTGAALLLSIIASVASIQSLHKLRTPAVGFHAPDEVLDAVDALRNAVIDLKMRFDGIEASISLQRQARLSVDSESPDAWLSQGSGDGVAASPAVDRGPARVSAQTDDGRFSPPGSEAPPAPEMLIVDPAPEQQAVYEAFDKKLDDPDYLRTLSLKDLLENSELNAIPEPLRRLILDKAVEKFNRGELDSDTFIGQLQEGG